VEAVLLCLLATSSSIDGKEPARSPIPSLQRASGFEGVFDFLGQLNRAEVFGRVQSFVLFVCDSNQSVLLSARIRQLLIDLSEFERSRIVLVADANYKAFSLISFH
jgi:hypothetical protein